MTEHYYKQPSHNEIVMAFVASCIESVAQKLEIPYIDAFNRMEKVGMLDKYILPCYDTLHTESRENLTLSLIETLNRWENEN